MAQPSCAPARTPASTSDILSDLLKRAGVDKSSTIRVTGQAGLAALLWLCRHGYEQVSYVRGGPCPSEDSDLLLVPQTCDLQTLEGLLNTGPHPRDGGLLIVQTPEPATSEEVDPVHDLLIRSGYRIERRLHGRHRELYVARRAKSFNLRIAA